AVSMTGDPVTVSIGDCLVLPLNVVVIAAVSAPAAVTMRVALEDPAGTARGDCTAATPGLLLDTEIIDAAGTGPVRLTVPCTVLPAATLVAFSGTLATAAVVGPVGEPLLPPH